MLPYTVAPFSQVNAMSGLGTASAAAAAGACHNFTIDWLSRMIADDGLVSGSPTQRIAQLSWNRGAGNPVLQKVFGQRWAEGGNSYKLADTMMIMIRGLQEIELTFDYSPFVTSQLVHAVTAPAGRGMIYSFWFPGTVVGAAGAHTIGFFRRLRPAGGRLVPVDGYISCFDPNFGECHVQESSFAYWLGQMTAQYGGVLTAHMLKVVDAR